MLASLLAAIRLKAEDQIQKIIRTIPVKDYLTLDDKQLSISHYAACYGSIFCLEYIRKILPEALLLENPDNITPFIMAVIHDQTNIVNYYIHHKIDQFATIQHEKAFRYNLILSDIPADGSIPKDKGNLTPLFYAAASGNVRGMELVLNFIPIPKEAVNFYADLFKIAIKNNHLQIIIALLDQIEFSQYQECLNNVMQFIQGDAQPYESFIDALMAYNKKDYNRKKLFLSLIKAFITGCFLGPLNYCLDFFSRDATLIFDLPELQEIIFLLIHYDFISGLDSLFYTMTKTEINKELVSQLINKKEMLDSFEYQSLWHSDKVWSHFTLVWHGFELKQRGIFILNYAGHQQFHGYRIAYERLLNQCRFSGAMTEKELNQAKNLVSLLKILSDNLKFSHKNPSTYSCENLGLYYIWQIFFEKKYAFKMSENYISLIDKLYILGKFIIKESRQTPPLNTLSLENCLKFSKLAFFTGKIPEAIEFLTPVIQHYTYRSVNKLAPVYLYVISLTRLTLIIWNSLIKEVDLPLKQLLLNIFASDKEIIFIDNGILTFIEVEILNKDNLENLYKKIKYFKAYALEFEEKIPELENAVRAAFPRLMQEMIVLLSWLSLMESLLIAQADIVQPENLYLDIYYKDITLFYILNNFYKVKYEILVYLKPLWQQLDIFSKIIDIDLSEATAAFKNQYLLTRNILQIFSAILIRFIDEKEILVSSKKAAKKRKKKSRKKKLGNNISDLNTVNLQNDSGALVKPANNVSSENKPLKSKKHLSCNFFNSYVSNSDPIYSNLSNKRKALQVFLNTNKDKSEIILTAKRLKYFELSIALSDEALKFMAAFEPNQIFLSGGTLRDIFLDKQPKDYDFVVIMTSEKFKLKFPEAAKKGKGKHYSYQVSFKELLFDIILCYSADNNQSNNLQDQLYVKALLRKNSEKRDFTVNALYWNYNIGLIDFHQGLIHLLFDQQLVHIYTQQKPVNYSYFFMDNPMALLRAVRISQKTGLAIPNTMALQIQTGVQHIYAIDYQRLFQEYHYFVQSAGIAQAHDYLYKYKLYKTLKIRQAGQDKQIITESDLCLLFHINKFEGNIKALGCFILSLLPVKTQQAFAWTNKCNLLFFQKYNKNNINNLANHSALSIKTNAEPLQNSQRIEKRSF